MYIIAEIGVNHNGSVELAEKLIDAAARAGAHAVKFQHFKADKLASLETPKVKYQMRTSDPAESHHAMLKNLEISVEIESLAIRKCKELRIDFISTPYDPDAADHLISLGCKFIKTASADIVDHRIHKKIANSDARALIATGMATLDEISSCMAIYEKACKKPVLLHCVSNYPCSQESLNLRVIVELARKFNVDIGFSDHSVGHSAATIAYSLGASFFEKHFTLDKGMPGPDHLASSTPSEFFDLIQALKATELVLGSPEKKVQLEEMQMKEVSRKSACTSREIQVGEVITEECITMMRPGGGICGSSYFDLIGRKAVKVLPKGVQLKLSDIE